MFAFVCNVGKLLFGISILYLSLLFAYLAVIFGLDIADAILATSVSDMIPAKWPLISLWTIIPATVALVILIIAEAIEAHKVKVTGIDSTDNS